MHEITIVEALFLGLVQGFTEWLPISSSGHLVIFQSLLGISVPPEFDIVIMMGTIAALILYLRKKILTLLRGIVALERTTLTYVGLIVVSGIPTGIIGFAGKQFFKALFGEPFIVSLLIIVTGIFLFIASQPKDQKEEVGLKSALWIGAAQGIAVAPGISRSGATIGTALLLGNKTPGRSGVLLSDRDSCHDDRIRADLPGRTGGRNGIRAPAGCDHCRLYCRVCQHRAVHEMVAGKKALLFFPLLCDCREYLCGAHVPVCDTKTADCEERFGGGSYTASQRFRVSPIAVKRKISGTGSQGNGY